MSLAPWRGNYGSALIFARVPTYSKDVVIETLYTASHSSLTMVGGLHCWPGCKLIDNSAPQCKTLAVAQPPPEFCAATGECVQFNTSQLVWSISFPPGENSSWKIVNNSWSTSRRIFPNSASSSSGSLYVAGGHEGFDRFFANVFKSDDDGKTWVDIAETQKAPFASSKSPFNGAMGRMQELNGCMVLVGGFSRNGSDFLFLDDVLSPR